MNKTNLTITFEDKEKLYEIMRLIGFERPAKKSNQTESAYIGKAIKDCVAYASKNNTLNKPSLKEGDYKHPDIEILMDTLKEYGACGKCDLESMKKIKDKRLFNIVSDFISNLQTKYFRLSQKEDLMVKFVEAIRKPNTTKADIVNSYGVLPKALKDMIQPLYNQILRLKFDSKKKGPMTLEEEMEEITIKSKLQNFDSLDSALTNLKKVLFNFQQYSKIQDQSTLRQSIQANISGAPEDTQRSLTQIYKALSVLKVSSNDKIVEKEFSHRQGELLKESECLRNQIQQLTVQNQDLQERIQTYQKAKASDEAALSLFHKKQGINNPQKMVQLQSTNAKLLSQLQNMIKVETISKISLSEYNTMKRDLSSLREQNDKLKATYKEQTSRMNELIKEVRIKMNTS